MKKHFNKQLLNRFPIKYKLLISLIPTVILSYVFFVFTADMLSFQETRRIVHNQADINMSQKSLLVDTYLNKIQTETEFFMFDSVIQKKLMIDRDSLNDTEQDQLNTDIKQFMYNIIINYDYNVQSVCVKTFQDDIYLWKMDVRDPHNQFLTRMNKLESEARKLQGDMYLSYEKLHENQITVSRIITNPITNQELGLLMIDFNLDFLANPTSSTKVETEPMHAILNSEGKVLYNSSPLKDSQLRILEKGQTSLKAEDDNFRVSIRNSAYSDWKVIGLLNETEIYANIRQIYFTQIGLLLISLISMIGLIYLVSHVLSQQFQLFIKKIDQTTAIEDHDMVHIDSKDEFSELANVYNKMLMRIKNLIHTIYSKELQIKNKELSLKNAEIKALQAQINPHFLYNTLDCINGLIELNRPEETKKTVTALANIMRMSIKGEEFLPVRKNLDYINQYMFIEKMRYQDKLLFLCEVPETMMEYMMPKLILQPVLENSIIHGISSMMEQGMVGLFGHEEEDSLVFCIKDNGAGIPQSVIERIANNEISKKDHLLSNERIGLINIQARIQLLYGSPYGIQIKNLSPSGSSVTIRIPKTRRDEHEYPNR